MSTNTIDIETVPQTQAVARIESGAMGRAMSIDELHNQLEFIREVMRKEMKDGTDYGKIPGTGDRKTLLQPGAQKLLMTFNLQEEVKKEVLREYPNMHREYEFTITVIAQNGKRWDGVGTCSTLESKYRYRKAERKCPKCGKSTIIQGKEEFGGGWICWKKKGGCDAKFAQNEPAIANQPGGVVENEDPADVWNTVRKMAFKRGLVAAAINATNTSELWTQDLEEIEQNEEIHKERERQRAKPAATPASAPPKPAIKAEKPWPQNADNLTFVLTEGLKDFAEPLILDYLKQAGILLPNEGVKDWPFRWLPTCKSDMDALRREVKAFSDGATAKKPYEPHELAEPEKPKAEKKADAPKTVTIDPEWKRVVGVVETVSKKDSPPESAKKWTRWGIKIGGVWYSTFSRDLGELAEASKGCEITLYYSTNDRGNTAEHIETVATVEDPSPEAMAAEPEQPEF